MRFSSICISWRSLRSSAPSGSSSSSTSGWLTIARASATRWRCPPESWTGLPLAEALELDERERLLPHGACRSGACTPFTLSPYSTFSATVMCGKSA